MVRVTEAIAEMARDCRQFSQPLPVVRLPAVACYTLARCIESDLGSRIYEPGKGSIKFAGIEFRYDDNRAVAGEWYV